MLGLDGEYRAHPHIHGEHNRETERDIDHKGSPPYTWGALPDPPLQHRPTGITPIYMGSTGASRQGTGMVRDHPHIHGEHSSPRDASAVVAGSPPYTWGAQDALDLVN